MNMKQNLSHAGIAGLFLAVFASAAFAEIEQLREQQQIQQQQREQIQNSEHLAPGRAIQQQDQIRSRTMMEEQERVHQQQQIQEQAIQRGRTPLGDHGMRPRSGGTGGGRGR